MRTVVFLVSGLALCAWSAMPQGTKPPNPAASGKAPVSAPAPADWVVMHDSREDAFSIEVPKGWKTSGGAYRLGANNPRFLIDMTSPDGHTNLRVGDSAVPSFTVPNPGAPEGMRYSTGV